MNRDEYIAMVEKWTRAQILSCCRAGGITAHKLKTNRELAKLLWLNFGKPAAERNQ